MFGLVGLSAIWGLLRVRLVRMRVGIDGNAINYLMAGDGESLIRPSFRRGLSLDKLHCCDRA
ncbi:MAG: hypothetical protein AAFY54_21675, partial [Cyanobacteria bacterium J06648_10]